MTGRSFEEVAGMTPAQFKAVQKAAARHWRTVARVSGFGAKVPPDEDSTAALEAKVRKMKRLTGKKSLGLEEVM